MARLNAELVGSRIKAKRLDLKRDDGKWTQPYVANAINEKTGSKLQGADISRWETGRHLPNQDHMEALAEVLGTSVAEFYVDPSTGEETPDPFASRNGNGPESSETDRKLDQILRNQEFIAAYLGAQLPLEEDPPSEQESDATGTED